IEVDYIVRVVDILVHDIPGRHHIAGEYREIGRISLGDRVVTEICFLCKPLGDMSIESIEWMPYQAHWSAEVGGGLAHFEDFVLDVRKVEIKAISEVFRTIPPPQLHFPAFVFNFSGILRGEIGSIAQARRQYRVHEKAIGL